MAINTIIINDEEREKKKKTPKSDIDLRYK